MGPGVSGSFPGSAVREGRMRIVRCIGWAGLAALMAGCGSTPSYYTQRMAGAPLAVERAAPEALLETESAAPRRSARQAASAPRTASRTQVASSPRSAAAVSSSRAIDNTGAAPTAPAGEEARAEREQRARALGERCEEALKRSMNSICRGC